MGQSHLGQSTTNLYPANAREVGPQSRDLQKVWFGGGGKMVYLWYPTKVSFGRYFAGKASLSKIDGKWLRPLDACYRDR